MLLKSLQISSRFESAEDRAALRGEKTDTAFNDVTSSNPRNQVSIQIMAIMHQVWVKKGERVVER